MWGVVVVAWWIYVIVCYVVTEFVLRDREVEQGVVGYEGNEEDDGCNGEVE